MDEHLDGGLNQGQKIGNWANSHAPLPGYHANGFNEQKGTGGSTTNVTDSGHTHTFSGTLPNLDHNHPISVEVTNQNTGGTGTLGQASSHSIVNPYYVVNFIILAKVPRVS
tara:strand:- start:112 stop:444 length:333 start_codon:yes stop_codon:yes gene_type:complete